MHTTTTAPTSAGPIDRHASSADATLRELRSAETLLLPTPDDRALVLRRAFDAPHGLVFDALTRPELLRQWYGPLGWFLEVCDIDLRVGGVYRDIVRAERLVHTEALDGAWYAGESLVTTTLAPAGTRTVLTTTVRFPSPAARDTVDTVQMARGADASFGRLTLFLAQRSAQLRA